MADSRMVWVVDRFKKDTAVLVEDGTGRTLDVPRSQMAVGVHEGTVLRVPPTEQGGPDWGSAEPDEELRRQRLAEAQGVLDELKTRDPGGDVVL